MQGVFNEAVLHPRPFMADYRHSMNRPRVAFTTGIFTFCVMAAALFMP